MIVVSGEQLAYAERPQVLMASHLMQVGNVLKKSYFLKMACVLVLMALDWMLAHF